MNSVKKVTLTTVNILIFIVEILLIYLIINSSLSKDYISPTEITFYEYIKIKLSNLL